MNRKDIDCNVIIDLLPLYKEEICSEATRELVEEHLRSCEDCRQLCENMILPEPEKKAVPDEAEAFKKVGKKLKKSRFTKVMAVLMSVFLAIFLGFNGAWYFLKYRPMKKLCEGMQLIERDSTVVKQVGIYGSTDDKYFYVVRLPDYLSFSTGYVTIAPLESVAVNGDGGFVYKDTHSPVITIPHELSGRRTYQIICESDAEENGHKITYHFEVDEVFELINFFDNYNTEDARNMKDIITVHKDELNEEIKAAQKKWGEYLK
jgi:hypothetical protein